MNYISGYNKKFRILQLDTLTYTIIILLLVLAFLLVVSKLGYITLISTVVLIGIILYTAGYLSSILEK